MDATAIDIQDIINLAPPWGLDHPEAVALAEQQARALRRIGAVLNPPVPVVELVRRCGIAVEYDPLVGKLGKSQLGADGRWRITYPDPEAFDLPLTVGHQLKLILDHPFGDALYPPREIITTHLRKYYCAEYFAACLILPREWLTNEWQSGNHDLAALADLFCAPTVVLETRLRAIGLLP